MIGGFVITLDDANGLHMFGLKPPFQIIGVSEKMTTWHWRFFYWGSIVGRFGGTTGGTTWEDLGGDRGSLSPPQQRFVKHERQTVGWLVMTGTMDFYDFPFKVGNGIIIPTDFRIFFRGVGQPPTSFSNEVRPLNFWRWLDYPRSIVKWNPSNPTPCVGPQWIWFEEKVGPWISFLHVNLPPQNLQFFE